MTESNVEITTITSSEGEVTKLVPLDSYEVVVDERDDHNRLLAVVHMHLTEGDGTAALRVIRQQRGWGAEDAHVLRSIIDQATPGLLSRQWKVVVEAVEGGS